MGLPLEHLPSLVVLNVRPFVDIHGPVRVDGHNHLANVCIYLALLVSLFEVGHESLNRELWEEDKVGTAIFFRCQVCHDTLVWSICVEGERRIACLLLYSSID